MMIMVMIATKIILIKMSADISSLQSVYAKIVNGDIASKKEDKHFKKVVFIETSTIL